MHKGVILLVKTDNREDAISQVREFMDAYGDGNVWDWYVIGGRWSGTLNANCKKFFEMIDEKYPLKEGEIGRTHSWIEKHSDEFQKMWESLGETSTNPYTRSSYSDEPLDDDVLPLKDCLDVVKEWSYDSVKEGKRLLKEAKRWIKPQNKNNAWGMYGYALRKAGSVFGQYFCFETNVFDTYEHIYEIPENIDEYYAVMVDMHN